ncbi:MAG: lipase family protein [Magnetospiraceae bacterium]
MNLDPKDRLLAQTCARLCALAYENHDRATVQAGLKDLGIDHVTFFQDDRTGADGYLAWRSDSAGPVYLVFAGTEVSKGEWEDVLTDVKIRRREVPQPNYGRNVGVHRGFLAQWEAVRKDVLQMLDTLGAPVYQTVITGHSLGGAVAILAAFELSCGNLVTFGAPRVGDAVFADVMSEITPHHHRFTRGVDIVPLLPPLSFGYRHDCNELYLTGNGQVSRWPWWRAMARRARQAALGGFSLFGFPMRLLDDHWIDRYLGDL